MNPCSTCAQPIYISQWHFQNSGPISIIWNQVHTAYNTKNSEKNIACLVEMRFGYLILRCLPNCDILRIFKSESLYIAPNGVKSKPRLHKKNMPKYTYLHIRNFFYFRIPKMWCSTKRWLKLPKTKLRRTWQFSNCQTYLPTLGSYPLPTGWSIWNIQNLI